MVDFPFGMRFVFINLSMKGLNSMGKTVVRFAHRTTGYLHIGGARVATFNWLFDCKHKGKFILHEDTDAGRSSESSVEGILDGLRWLGLEWNAGPFFQSRVVESSL